MTRVKLLGVVVVAGLSAPVVTALTVGVGFDVGCRIRARRRRAAEQARRRADLDRNRENLYRLARDYPDFWAGVNRRA